ncbi:hypothetical protein MKL11_30530 [Methylobacterium sp. J-077]|nr:hypothetical protein [Methylobacterium sp. J-077]
MVGIPGGSQRSAEPGQPNPPDNATLGYLNEFGVPEKNIPARPFLLPGVESVKEAVAARLKKAIPLAMAGDRGAVDATLNAVGLIAVDAVQQKLLDGPFPPLSPRTLKARKARGRTGEKPLIDKGLLRRSITYSIREKGPGR